MDRLPLALIALASALVCVFPACDRAEGRNAGHAGGHVVAHRDPPEDPSWFKYTPPEEWTRFLPPTGITLAPWAAVFIPHGADGARLEIWKITDEVSRTEFVPELYADALERGWRGQCAEARKRGQLLPIFGCEGAPTPAPAIRDTSKVEGLHARVERDGKLKHSLLYFVTALDGRRFRVLYSGEEPAFTRHRAEIVASLASLSFPVTEPTPPPLTRAQVVADLSTHLDGNKLWIEDGKVAGRRLCDAHLAALTNPVFAGVTDLNLFSDGAASSVGTDVTDAGLVHLARLPLKSLSLRGSLVTDAGLAHLKGLPLETLSLAHTLVKGEGLRHLRGLPLKVLDLDHTNISDENLSQLDGLPLAMLHVRETRCTRAGLAGLQQRLPKAIVGFDPQ